MMFRVLCLLCGVGAVFGATDMNQLLDQLLDVLRPQIVRDGKDELPIDKVNYNFNHEIYFFTVTGKISCGRGKARYLSTIKRTGDASGDINSEGVTIRASVGLEIFQFLFDSCELSVNNLISLTQSLGGTVGKNSIAMELQYLGKEARIDKISVDSLSDINITTGTSLIHKLENNIINGMVKAFNSAILSSINKQLKQFEGKIIPLAGYNGH